MEKEQDLGPQICESCLRPKAAEGAQPQSQWKSFCRCGHTYLTKSNFSIDVCAACKMRVPTTGGTVNCAGLCSCAVPQPKKVVSYLQKGDKDPVDLDLTSEGLSEEIFPWERYAPIALLGDSPRSTTVLARDRARGAKVAVKCLKRVPVTLKSVFESEAKKNKELNHTNIAKLLDYGFQNNKAPYLVSEYKDGFNVQQCVAIHGIPSFDVAVKILIGICEALIYAAKQSLLHRDIRPGNVIFFDDMNSEPAIFVTDFALPKVKAADEQLDKEEAMWMSGDEARNLDFSEKSEVYSIGSVGFLLLSGEAPFTEGTAQDIKNSHALKLPPRIPKLNFDPLRPKELEEIVERCMEKDPGYRFETVEKLNERLEVFPRRQQMQINEIAAAKQRAKIVKLTTAIVAAVAVVAIAMVAVGHH